MGENEHASGKHLALDKNRPSLFRSEDMALCQFYFPDEVAYQCIDALGHLEAVHFLDANEELSPKERPYTQEVMDLEEALQTLRDLESEINKRDLKIAPKDENLPTPTPGDLMEIRDTMNEVKESVNEARESIDSLKKSKDESLEMKAVLKLAKKHLQSKEDLKKESLPDNNEDDDVEAGTRDSAPSSMKMNIVGGTVRREQFPSMEQTLFRASRGTLLMKNAQIDHEFEDPQNDQPVFKNAFLTISQGNKMKEIVDKVNDGYKANIYPIPDDPKDFDDAIAKATQDAKYLDEIIDATEEQYDDLLYTAAKNLENWYDQILRMKAAYAQLNNFSDKPHVAQGWVPVEDLPKVKATLKEIAKDSGGVSEPIVTTVDTSEEPPTYNFNDKFTKGFQVLINSYGIPTYKELNPMPYTVISFPFLFALMFGDLGHGTLLFAFGVAMIAKEKKLEAKKSKNEIRNIMVGGRYIIAMMGLFSMYSGFIYNDCFAISLNVFGSRWHVNADFDGIQSRELVQLDPAYEFGGYPYPIGMDPVWFLAENKIIFRNSLKMKMSIIIGVFEMVFGLFLSLSNYWYFGQISNIFCMFMPQILWMVCLFGYLCFLMIFKWISYGPFNTYEHGTSCAPSVLIIFIDMILHKPPPDVAGCPQHMYPFEYEVEQVFFLVAMICIPWLLLMKPIVVFRQEKAQETKEERLERKLKKRQQKQKKKRLKEEAKAQKKEEKRLAKEKKKREKERKKRGSITEEDPEKEEEEENKRPKEEVKIETEEPDDKKSKGEFMIHQAIITIEYILGTISHTASYLRLWALSLAHSQLSEVLWSMVLGEIIRFALGVPVVGFLLVFVGWAAWAVLTVAILVLMEGLSAFLHTLRLHWVEFNSKFYSGLGYEYIPFSYKKIVEEERG